MFIKFHFIVIDGVVYAIAAFHNKDGSVNVFSPGPPWAMPDDGTFKASVELTYKEIVEESQEGAFGSMSKEELSQCGFEYQEYNSIEEFDMVLCLKHLIEMTQNSTRSQY